MGKPKEKGLFKALWWVFKIELRTSPGYFAWNIVYSIVDGLDSIVYAYFAAQFLASVTVYATSPGSTQPMFTWLILMLVIEPLSIMLRNLNNLFATRFRQKVELVTNQMLFYKLYQLSQAQFDDEAFNTRLDRAFDAVSSTGRAQRELSWALSAIVTLVGSLGAIVVVSPLVGLVVLAIAVPISIISFHRNTLYEKTNKKIEPTERQAMRSRWSLLDPQTMPEIRIMNAFKQLVAHWRSRTTEAHKVWFAHEKRVFWLDFVSSMAQPVISLAAMVYFLRLFINGVIPIDRLLFLRSLLEQASGAAVRVADSMESLHELAINFRNFQQVYDAPPSIPNGTVTVEAPLTIEFKDVCFTYPNAQEPALMNVSFRIFPGSQLALVGENGAGKTTLIKLLLRMYVPSSGQIIVNGTDITDIEQESYYRAIGNLSQEFLIMSHLTIRENLLLGVERKVSDKKIMEVAALAGADTFIKKLKFKLSQRLDTSFKDGTGLSGGQLQRSGVTRALLRKGDIMILDEPTSAIDAKAEYAIFNNIYKVHGGKTTLIVSHRFSTVRKADKIIVMEGGRITEYGSHEELLDYGGLYKEMFEAQAEGYK